jgi:hypothetical protein
LARKPCQPMVVIHGGSIRPVDGWCALLPGPFWIEYPLQSALSQYTDPGTRRGSADEPCWIPGCWHSSTRSRTSPRPACRPADRPSHRPRARPSA